MRLRIAILFAIAATLCTRMPAQTLTRVLSGYCDTVSNPGQEFVLFGLGERFTAPYAPGKEYTACTFGPGSPSVFLGEVVGNGGTVKNLYVKQTQLN